MDVLFKLTADSLELSCISGVSEFSDPSLNDYGSLSTIQGS